MEILWILKMYLRECALGRLLLSFWKKCRMISFVLLRWREKPGYRGWRFINIMKRYDALTDYLNIIIIEYIDACKNNSKNGSFRDSGSILFALNFFDRYREFFLTLSGHGLHSILIKGINDFMSKYYVKGKNYSSYSLYCYAGGLLNVFLKWEEEGCSQPAEEVAKTLYELYNSMKW